MPNHARALPLLAAAALLSACGGAEDAPAPTESASDTAAAPASAPASAAPVTFASLSGDAARGERVFGQCRACHAIVPGQNMIGPSLHGVVGRKAGAVPGYAYSPANKASAKVWDAETLFTYLEAPVAAIPGTRMAYVLRDPQQRADVIAYLATLK